LIIFYLIPDLGKEFAHGVQANATVTILANGQELSLFPNQGGPVGQLVAVKIV
jgi:hypothetical protein